MNIIEAKEILVKAGMCHMMPIFEPWCTERKGCENCQFYVKPDKEQEAFNYLYNMMKEVIKHETGDRT